MYRNGESTSTLACVTVWLKWHYHTQGLRGSQNREQIRLKLRVIQTKGLTPFDRNRKFNWIDQKIELTDDK